MTTYAIGIASVLTVMIVLWPLRTWMSEKMATRTGQALGTATIFALTLQSILTLFVVPLFQPLPNAFSQETTALQVRATALQERYARYRVDLANLGTKPAADSPTVTEWQSRQKTIEAERLAAGAAVDQLAADVALHNKARAGLNNATDAHIRWALLASLICFIAVFAGCYLRNARLTRS